MNKLFLSNEAISTAIRDCLKIIINLDVKGGAYKALFLSNSKCFVFNWWLAYSVRYTEPIVAELRKRYFWNNWIIKVGGENKHGPGESYNKLYFFFKLNDRHTYIPL